MLDFSGTEITATEPSTNNSYVLGNDMHIFAPMSAMTMVRLDSKQTN